MTSQFQPEIKLSKVKKRILNLNPLTSDALELEFLMQNAFEIMSPNSQEFSDLSHTYNNKELSDLINGTINRERISSFKQVQQRCQSQIPDTNHQLSEIPDGWSMPQVTRFY